MAKKKPHVTPAAFNAMISGDLENFVVASTPGGIEAQEKQGQNKLVAPLNDLLPIKGTQGEERPLWEKMGFKFNDRPEDDLFISATFPAGWKKVATEHSMWSNLVDDKGRKRAAIFYKAAFYDRSSHVHLIPRFSCGPDYSQDAKQLPVVVKDGDTIVHTVGTEIFADWSGDRRQAEEYAAYNTDLKNQAKAWLTEHYPNWQDPTAHWD